MTLINFNKTPAAYSLIAGSEKFPNTKGRIDFYDVYDGTLVVVEVYGLDAELENLNSGFWGFHIHEGDKCAGNAEDYFAWTKMHYNPKGVKHPAHAGDLPPILSQDGVGWMAVYTKRFYPEEIVGRTAVIHSKADDFMSQPSGNAGEKIACGEIVAWDREIR